MSNFQQSLVFDPLLNTFITWSDPLLPSRRGGSCLVLWKSIFLYFGGYSTPLAVQMFNILTQNWEILAYSALNFFVLSDCTVLPNEKILIASLNGWALYNPETNHWDYSSGEARVGKTLVTLSGRVFELGSEYLPYGNFDTEEYDFNSNDWIPVDVQLISPANSFRSAIALPAKLFEQLPGGCVGI